MPVLQQPYLGRQRLTRSLYLTVFVAAVTRHAPGFDVVLQLYPQDILDQGLPRPRLLNGKEELDPAIQVAWHQIRTAEQHVILPTVTEIIDTRML
jgi:hypothetical protein